MLLLPWMSQCLQIKMCLFTFSSFFFFSRGKSFLSSAIYSGDSNSLQLLQSWTFFFYNFTTFFRNFNGKIIGLLADYILPIGSWSSQAPAGCSPPVFLYMDDFPQGRCDLSSEHPTLEIQRVFTAGSISGSLVCFSRHQVSPCPITYLRLPSWRDTVLLQNRGCHPKFGQHSFSQP